MGIATRWVHPHPTLLLQITWPPFLLHLLLPQLSSTPLSSPRSTKCSPTTRSRPSLVRISETELGKSSVDRSSPRMVKLKSSQLAFPPASSTHGPLTLLTCPTSAQRVRHAVLKSSIP